MAVKTPATPVARRIHFGRQPSWVVHNELGDDRSAVESAVRRALSDLPASYMQGAPVFARSSAVNVLFAVLDERDLGDRADEDLVIVLSVQTPMTADTARAGDRANCHWASEIWPSREISIIPIAYEFARGSRPEKRLNFIVDGDGGGYQRLDDGDLVVTGFRHFVSAAYSRFGLATLDFHLSVRHRPPNDSHAFAEWEFAPTREQFVNRLQRDLRVPLAEIENEMYEDRGVLAPSAIREIDSLFAKVLTQTTDTAYSNLDLFKQEWESNINPRLRGREAGEAMVVPADVASAGHADQSAGRALARVPGALAVLLFVADRHAAVSPSDLPLELVAPGRRQDVAQALAAAGLVSVDALGLRATERGTSVVRRLRGAHLRPGDHAGYRPGRRLGARPFCQDLPLVPSEGTRLPPRALCEH